MIILIAESKTMSAHQFPLTSDQYLAHRPIFEHQSEELVYSLRNMRQEELARLIGVSDKQARLAQMLFYDFTNKTIGYPAYRGFTGVVFRNSDIDTLSRPNLDYAESRVRILSSLYGMLRLTDIIKPYRFDYSVKAAPGDRPMYYYWKNDVTEQLLEDIRQQSVPEVLSLLPRDAAKSIDWKIIKQNADIRTVDFKLLVDATQRRTPSSNNLKELRGKMLKSIIENRIESFSSLTSFESEEYAFESDNGEILYFVV